MNLEVINNLTLSVQSIDGELISYGTPLDQRDLSFLQELPGGDDWLSIDLDNPDITDDLRIKLKGLQCDTIRGRRADLYKSDADGLFFGSQADGDSLEAWQSKRAEIKDKFPWPGSYR